MVHHDHVAGDIGFRIFGFAHLEEKFIHWIRQVEKLEIWLQVKNRVFAQAGQFGLRQDRELGSIKGFNIGTFQPDHIQRHALLVCDELWMLAQPGFQPRTEIAQRV